MASQQGSLSESSGQLPPEVGVLLVERYARILRHVGTFAVEDGEEKEAM
jgi:hypothetical protein